MGHEIEPYLQETSFSCGSASLLIVYHKLGIEYNEPTLMLELGTTKEGGTEMIKIFQHATNLGFPTEMKAWGTYGDLQRDSKRGIIIVSMTPFWDGEPGGHYAVIEDILPEYIELADPGIPPSEWPEILSRDEFISKWFVEGYHASYLLVRPKSSKGNQ